MKKSVIISFITVIFISIGTITPQISNVNAMEDGIIAIVNDELITLKDLKEYIQQTYVSLVGSGMEENQLKEIMLDMEVNGLNKLIEDKLILSRANEIGIEVQDKIVQEKFDELRNKYASEEEFQKSLVQNSVTITELRKKIVDQLKIKYVIDYEVRSKIYINPQEVTDFYLKNKSEFTMEEQVNVSSIFLAFGPEASTARQKAQEILIKLKDGEDFEVLQKQYSNAPSVGIIKRGKLLAKIENQVFSLNLNEVSPIVEVDTGIYIFKLLGKNEAKTAELSDVKDQINNIIFRKKFADEFQKWLNKQKKNAYIEIKQ